MLGLRVSYSLGLGVPYGRVCTPVERLVDTGEGPVLAFYLDNLVDGLGKHPYSHVNLDGLKLNGAAGAPLSLALKPISWLTHCGS